MAHAFPGHCIPDKISFGPQYLHMLTVSVEVIFLMSLSMWVVKDNLSSICKPRHMFNIVVINYEVQELCIM